MIEFCAVIAGVKILFRCRTPECRRYFADYEVPDLDRVDLVCQVSDQKLEELAKQLETPSMPYVEMTALYEPLARYMPSRHGFVFHGAAISFDGGAYVFTAPSGTGKTTHIRLWRKYLGKKIDIINGDKPIITAEPGKKVMVHGTPWSGKEGWQKNRSVPLKAICLVLRDSANHISHEKAGDQLPFIFRQTFFCEDAQITQQTLEVLDRVLLSANVWRLGCDISEAAVKCSFEAMTGQDYFKNRIVLEKK